MHNRSRQPGDDTDYSDKVRQTLKRKLRARRAGDQGVWFGFGMFGLVGWSVAIPALVAIASGVWLDMHTDSPYSWTLMLLVLGVFAGCLNAWFWISRERRNIEHQLHDEGSGANRAAKESKPHDRTDAH